MKRPIESKSRIKSALAVGAGFSLLLLFLFDVVFDFRKPSIGFRRRPRR